MSARRSSPCRVSCRRAGGRSVALTAAAPARSARRDHRQPRTIADGPALEALQLREVGLPALPRLEDARRRAPEEVCAGRLRDGRRLEERDALRRGRRTRRTRRTVTVTTLRGAEKRARGRRE